MKKKKKNKSLLKRYKMGTNRKVLPKYQAMSFGDLGGGGGAGGGGIDINNYTFDEGALLDTQGGDYWDPAYEGSSDQKTDNSKSSSGIASGIAAGLNAVAGGLDVGTAAIKASTKSEIDPSSVYAYDSENSRWMEDKEAARTTQAVTGAIGQVASAIPGGQIIGAGFNVGSAATGMGLADMEKRLIRGHDAMYKQRKNVGGHQGDFTTQGQFTTFNERDTEQPMGKMGGYLKKYQTGSDEIRGKRVDIDGTEYNRSLNKNREELEKKLIKPYTEADREYIKRWEQQYKRQHEPFNEYMEFEILPFKEELPVDNMPIYMQKGGSINKYRGGGLYANIHAKRARIKAGSEESMKKPGAEGAPSAQDFKDAAKTAKKGMGGYLESYMGGGYMPSYGMGTQVGVAQEVPRDMANAEVEGGGGNKRGETIYNAMDGTMDVVKGPKHSKTKEAGVPVVLKEGTPAEGGDFVFSDYLEITDPNTGQKMSVADFSLKYKDDPRMLEYAAQEQSRMANSKEKKKYGGMLKKYQQGTPTLTQEEIDALNALQGTGAPPSYMERRAAEAEVAARIAAEERQTSVQASAQAAQAQQQKAIAAANVPTAFTVRHSNQGGNVYTPAGATPATTTMQSITTKPLSSAQASAPAAPKTVAQAASSAGTASSTGSAGSAGSLGSSGFGIPAKFGTPGYLAALAPKMIAYAQSQKPAGSGAPSTTQKSTTSTTTTTGTTGTTGGTNQYGKRTTGQKILDYAPEIGAGLSGLAQVIGRRFIKNPYEDVDVPGARTINLPNQYFDRVTADAEREAAKGSAANAIEAGKQMGMPMEGFQQILNTEAELVAKAEERARNANISIDAAEKQLRASNEYQEQSFNATQLAAADAARLENELNRRGFDSAMAAQTVEDVAGVFSDASKFAADFRTANVMYGNENIRQRASNYDPAAAKEQIMKDYPKTNKETELEYNERIRKIQNKFAAQFFAQNNLI